MSYLCELLYESVIGSKRTSEYFLETKSQNDLKLPWRNIALHIEHYDVLLSMDFKKLCTYCAKKM